MLGYTSGLDEFRTWETDVFEAALLTTIGFDASHVFVVDMLAASTEVGVAGYVRATVTAAVRTTGFSDRRYTCAPLNFGTMAAGEIPVAAVLYKKVTDDTDSPLIGYYGLFGNRDTAAESPWLVSFNEAATLASRETSA